MKSQSAVVALPIGLAVLPISISAHEQLTYLECEMGPTSVVIGFDQKTQAVVDALSPDVSLVKTAVSEFEIKFASENRFHSHWLYHQWYKGAPVSDASSMTGRISRISGEITIRFFKENGAEAIAACRASSNGPWCDYAPLSATKHGQCKPVVKRF